MYRLDYKNIHTEFNENPEDDNKYMIFTCAKDENPYVKEWLDYHFSIGFDKVIICDNNDDNTTLPELLSDYIKKGIVELFDVSDYQKIQSALFDMFARQGHYKWCAFIDGDEFIEISGRYDNIKEMLNECDAECLCLNWMIYGTNGNEKKEDLPVQERFPLPMMPLSYVKENSYVKSILRKTNNPNITFKNPHIPYNCQSYNYGLEETLQTPTDIFKYPFMYKNAYIRHYISKSVEEYKAKQERGWSDCDDNILREKSHIDLITKNCDIPLEYFHEGLFDKKAPCFVRDSIGKYDMYVVKSQIERPLSTNYYVLNLLIGTIFSQTEGVTIVLDSKLDNNLYNVFLEVAIKTGNRLISCKKDKETYNKIYRKYHKKWNDEFMYLFLP